MEANEISIENNVNSTNNNTVNIPKTKWNNISLIRFISFLNIFVFHVLYFWTDFAENYFPFWFAVQVFLFISGFLYSKKEIKDTKKFYLKNGLKIIIPVVVLLLLFYAAYLIAYLCGYNVYVREVNPNGCLVSALGHLWFIYAICGCYFITPFLNKMVNAYKQKDKNKFQNLLILILIFVMIDFISAQFGNQLSLTSFILGYLFRYFYDGKFFQKNKKIIASISFVLFIGLSISYYFMMNRGGGKLL